MTSTILKTIRNITISFFFIFVVFLIVSYYKNYKNSSSSSTFLKPNFNYSMLSNSKGVNLSKHDFFGFPIVMFFGFTSCPDVCPITLDKISNLIDILGEKTKHTKFYFVTVDPFRDNLEKINDYLNNFNNKIVGITGANEDIQAFLKEMYIYSEIIYLDDKEYTVDHSASIYLIDRDGMLFGTIAYNENEGVALNKIKELIK